MAFSHSALGLLGGFLVVFYITRTSQVTVWPDAGFGRFTFQDDLGVCYRYEREPTVCPPAAAPVIR